MSRFKVWFSLPLILILITCKDTPEDARLKLGQMNISYTDKAFLKHIEKGDKVVVELFLKAGMDANKGLVTSAAYGQIDLVKFLIEEGADMSSDNAGEALVIAADRENYDICETLLNSGIDINTNRPAKTALLVSARRRNSNNFMKLLIDKGADVNLRDESNATSLILAARDSNKFEIAQLLLRKGADVNLADNSGVTALANSIRSGHIRTVKTLVEHEADINRKDKKGNSMLMMAVEKGDYNIVELLVDSGVDINARNHMGQTPLMRAESHNHSDIVKLLMRKGAIGEYKVIRTTNGGTIGGTVTYSGTMPAKTKLEITKDLDVCGKTAHFREDLLVSINKGLANVVVSLTNINKGKGMEALGNQFFLDQKGCTFVPHVLIIPTQIECTILNSDGILHNIHTFSEVNKQINIAQPRFKKKITQRFNMAETFRVKCDVHNWMVGYIVVVDHPYYAKTDKSGKFEISDIPPGNYKVEYWHERLGKQFKEIRVTQGSSIDVSCKFNASP